MLFNSWGYVLLMLLAVPLHWLLPGNRTRTPLLCAVSLLFYCMWRWEFSVLVLASALTDYTCALRMAATDNRKRRRAWLSLSLFVNFGLLIAFKYTYFIWDNVRLIGGDGVPELADLGVRIILPLGISFYTFQTVSYSIDVYRRVIQPTRDFVTFLTYVTFWPQLIAGPVLRASEVVPQLKAHRRFDVNMLCGGLVLVVTGLFKKVVIADNISGMVDEAFAMNVASLTAPDVWVANFLFGFQIYFDFAGYSDIAIGSAMMLGMYFPKNFNWPYMARSPRDFWSRWHISLSSWIRDYLYLPLTGERFKTHSVGGISEAATKGGSRRNGALLLTWFIMGLWHGAAWTFALWGMYHAALILLYRTFKPLRVLPDRRPMLSWLIMLPLAMAGWIAFRATSMPQALSMFARIFDPTAYTLSGRAVDMYAYFWAGAITLGMTIAFGVQRSLERSPAPRALALPAMGLMLATMVCCVLICMRTVQQFIYFQF
jgi:D-alanyl-lipoteichoic acid acyltransferase DltB (MBOAT superfamily)